MFVNGEPAGDGVLKRSAFRHGLEPFEVGRDSTTPVDPASKDRGRSEFTGKIGKVASEPLEKRPHVERAGTRPRGAPPTHEGKQTRLPGATVRTNLLSPF